MKYLCLRKQRENVIYNINSCVCVAERRRQTMNGVHWKRLLMTAIIWMAAVTAAYALGMGILYISSAPDQLFWAMTAAYVVLGMLCGLLAGRWASLPGMILGSAAAYIILWMTEHDLAGWLAQGLAHGTEHHTDTIFYVSATRQSLSILLFLLAALLVTAVVCRKHRQHA